MAGLDGDKSTLASGAHFAVGFEFGGDDSAAVAGLGDAGD
jgi:hypothetical protein